MSDLIITPSSGKIDFIYQSGPVGQEGQTSRLESIIIDPIDGLVFSGKISASSVTAPLNVTATSSNINYPFIFASSGETGAKSLLMDSDGGTYNPSTNLATVNISGTSSWATNAVTNANLTGDVTSVGNATTIANSVVTNAKLANSSVTIGSTAISLGATPTVSIAGLTSVTSTTFVGALTGTATTASYANALNAANSYTVVGITGNLTGTATTASYANNLNAANQYTVGGITGSHFGTSSWATNATNALQLGGVAAASYVTLTGAQNLSDKTITGTFTGALTGTATTASYANNLNAANSYTIAGLTVNGNFAVNGSLTVFSASNVYITSSNLVVTDNIITMNALSPYQRYAGIQMYDSGSGTLSNFLWDGDGDYFFLSGSSVNGKIITGPDSQANLSANFVPKATAGYKLGNSLIYDSGTNIGIGITTPVYKTEIYSGVKTSAFTGLSISNFNNYDGTDNSLVKSQLRFAILENPISTYDASQRTFAILESGNEANNSSSDGFFAISTRLNGAVAEKFRITSTGNVGIGTTNPAAKLYINASGSSINLLRGVTYNDSNASFNNASLEYYDTSTSNASTVTKINYNAYFNKRGTANITGYTVGNFNGSTQIDSGSVNLIWDYSSRIEIRNQATASSLVHFVADSGYVTAQGGVLGKATDRIGFFVRSQNQSALTLTNQYGIYIEDLGQSTNNYAFYSNVSAASNKYNIYAAGTANNYFAGYVGIGATSFVYGAANRGLLEVYGSSDALIALRNDTANFYIHKSGNNFAMVNGGAGYMTFNTNGSDRLYIDSNGYIGIATTSILTTGGNAQLSISTNTTAVALSFGASNNDMSYIRRLSDGVYQWQTYNSGNTGQIHLQPYGGSVGIGTTSPSSTLHVNSTTAGATLLRTDGTNGTLFSVVDDLSDSLMSVNNSAGLPVLEVFADDRIVMGQYGQNDFVLVNNKVGIGTNNPSFKLDITGSLGINASSLDTNWPFVVSDNSSAGSRYGLNKAGSMGFNNADNYAQLQLVGTNGAYLDLTNSVGGDSNARLIYYAGSRLDLTYGFTTTITLNSTGVGIGTTSPGTSLEVYAIPATTSSLNRMFIINTDFASATGTGFGGSIVFRGRTPGNLLRDNAQISAYNEDIGDNGYALGFYTRPSDGGGLQQRLTILRAGNVGIGTVGPGALLELSSSTATSLLNVKGAGGNGLLFVSGSGNVGIGTTTTNHLLHLSTISNDVSVGLYTTNANASARNWLISANEVAYGDFNIKQSNAIGGNPRSAGTSRFYIQNDGNVGVGIANPVAKLQVAGNISGSSFTSSISNAVGFLGTSSWATNATNALQLGGTAAVDYVTLTGTQTLTGKTITGTFTGNLTGTASWASNAVTALNGGVTSVSGTANQVIVSGNTGAVTFSLPQSIHTTATPTFTSVSATTFTGNLTGTATTASYANALNPANSYTVNSLTEGGYLAYPLREYVINFSALSATNFYPVAIDNPPGTDSTWHNQFSVDMTGQSGGAAYNMHSMYGEVRGQGWTDQNQFYRVFHTFYDSAERSILGIWRGTQTFYGVVVYLRGGKNYYVRTTSRSAVGYSAAQTLGNAVFAIKNAAGADVSGTSANIGEMLNLINNPSGFYHSDNAYIGTDKVLNLATTSAPNLSIGGTAATATNSTQLNGVAAASYVTLADTQSLSNKTLTSPILVTPALGTPSSGNLTSCTFPTLNQNTTGTAATASYANALNAANSYTVTNLTASGVGKFFGNIAIITDASANDYSLIGHSYAGTTKAFTGYNGGSAIYGGESTIPTRIQAGGQYVISVLANGNVGIGTTSPLSKLHISGSGQTIMRLDSDTTTNVSQFQIKAASDAVLIMGMFGGSATGDNYGVTAAGQAYIGTTTLGSPHPTSLVIATASPIPTIFSTNNVERMRIDGTGLVGIGTTVPSGKLDVYNGVGRYLNYSTTGLLKIQRNVATSDGATPVLHLINTQGMESATGLGTGIQMDLGYGGFTTDTVGTAARGTRISAVNDTLYTSTVSTQNASLVFYTSTAGTLTEKMRVSSTGNVGIGTTVASASLHINSTTAGATLLRTDGTNGTLFSVVDDLSDSLMSVNNSAGLPVLEVFADDRIVAGQYGQNDFVVVNNKVGIGTNNPLAKLHVTGSSSVPAAVLMGNVGIGTTSFVYSNANRGLLEIYGSSDALISLRNATANSYLQKSGNDFYFNNGGAGFISIATNGSERMFIKSDGNVGIGTSVPTARVDTLGVRIGRDFSIANRATVRLDSNDTSYPSDVLFGHTVAANQDSWNGVYWSLSSRAAADGNKFYFYRGSGNPAPNNSEAIIMTFDPNLNVGIGITSPTTKLHVVGVISGSSFTGAGTGLTGTAANLSIGGTAATVTTNANLTGHITSTGNATILGSFTSAQLLAALTDETGTGASVFATSPTLVSPALGTPSSGVLTNCTGTAAGLTAGAVTNGVYTTGNQSIAGNKTFTGTTIVTGSIETAAVRETFSAVSSTTTVSIDLSTATVFNLTFTSTISAFNITNVNTSRVNSFTLITAPNGTGATIAWSFQTNGGVAANVKWASNVSPTATTTTGRFDIFSFVYNGTNWYGFTGGQNYV